MRKEEPKWQIGGGRFGRAKRLWQCLNRMDGELVDGVGAIPCGCPDGGCWCIGYLSLGGMSVGADSISAHLGN